MLDLIQDQLTKDCGLRKGRPVVAGVSGGPDSLCLLDLLQRAGYPVVVAHFDHRLRPGSDEDARAVRALAAERQLPYEEGAADVAAFARNAGMGIEEAARTLRYRFLFEVASAREAQAVAVGHTADDQAETILMHILRGTGLDGLTGMAARTVLPEYDPAVPLVRPLLRLWREQTEQHCRDAGLTPRIDPSNASTDFLRNRLRRELIPALESYNPRIREALTRMGLALKGDADLLDEIAFLEGEDCFLQSNPELMVLNRRVLAGCAPPIQKRIIRFALRSLAPWCEADFSTLERAAHCLAGHVPRVDLCGGAWMLVEGAHVYVAVEDAKLPTGDWPQLVADTLVLALPGELNLTGGWRLRAEELKCGRALRKAAQANADPFQAYLDLAALSAPLLVRPRLPGDRFQPLGMDSGSIKLSDFFVNEKLPERARDRWPLVCSGDAIAWLPGFRPGHAFRLQAGTRRAIHLTLTHED